MSHNCDEYYEFHSLKIVRARKEHKCCACGDPIRKGHRYASVTTIFERELHAFKRCLRCETIHKHLRVIGNGETYPSERLDCGETYEDHWGIAPPNEIAALAFVTPEEMQAQFAVSEGGDRP